MSTGCSIIATFSRLENAVDIRCCYRTFQTLFELYLRERGKDVTPEKVLLDLDATDDPTHDWTPFSVPVTMRV